MFWFGGFVCKMDALELLAFILFCFLDVFLMCFLWSKINLSISMQVPVNKREKEIKKLKNVRNELSMMTISVIIKLCLSTILCARHCISIISFTLRRVLWNKALLFSFYKWFYDLETLTYLIKMTQLVSLEPGFWRGGLTSSWQTNHDWMLGWWGGEGQDLWEEII